MIWGDWEAVKEMLKEPNGPEALKEIVEGIDKYGGSCPPNYPREKYI